MADGHQGQTEEISKSGNNAIRRSETKPAADSGNWRNNTSVRLTASFIAELLCRDLYSI